MISHFLKWVISSTQIYFLFAEKRYQNYFIGEKLIVFSNNKNFVIQQVLGLSLDEEEDCLVSDDKTISDQDKSTLIKLYTDLFMDYAKLILGVYR